MHVSLPLTVIPTKITTLRWVFLFHELLEIPTKITTLRWVFLFYELLEIPTKITTLRWVFLFHELLEIPTKRTTLRWVFLFHELLEFPTKITTLRWVFLFHELLEIPTKIATLRWVSSSHQQPFPLKSSPEMGFLSPTNSHSIKNSPQKWDFPHLRTVIRSKITQWDGIHYFGTVFLALLTLFLSFVIICTYLLGGDSTARPEIQR